MSQKRNRSINWDEEEKQLFRSVLKEYAQIIENKSLDTNINKIKTNAWEEVHKKFNQLNSRPRDLNQLKIQWKTMKINARKTYSTFKKEVNKTGENKNGARTATPNETIIEVKDLLNPAELLIDHNIYDSDGIMNGEFEPTIIDSNRMRIIHNSEQSLPLLDTGLLPQLELTPLEISQETATVATPMEKIVDSIPVKTSDDENITVETPIKKSMGTKSAKKFAKRKITTNNIVDSMKPRKDHKDYVNSMLSHSRMLKDEEHMRRMEIAEEEHKIKMEIYQEKFKSAILEREILELKRPVKLYKTKISLHAILSCIHS